LNQLALPSLVAYIVKKGGFMSKGKVELKPTEAQMKRMQELAAAITDLCEKEVKTHNPDGKIGVEDILIMLTSLQAVIDSSSNRYFQRIEQA
jgi:hypothetical protein